MANSNQAERVATPDMINAIRNEASPAYQNAVPEATQFNLQEVGNPIIQYESMANEFLTALANKIVFQLIDRKSWTSPVAFLKRMDMELGTDVEDIHINPVQAIPYDGTETGMAGLLKMYKPDVATVYYRLNRQDKYPQTINNQQLRGAFTSWGKLESLIGGITDGIYNGATIGEFNYTKNLIKQAVATGHIVQQQVVNPTNAATAAQFMKTLRALSALFTIPSTNYNAYAQITGLAPRTNWSAINDQVILIRADVATSVGIDLLATLFNVEYADYLARQVMIDDFGDDNTLAVLCDRKAFVIMDQLRQFATFYNGSSLGWQYFYHVWQLYAFSPFQNAVALVLNKVDPPTPTE